MKKILGLDLGSTSIGWAFLAEDENDVRILRAGSHIVFTSEEDVKEFSRGLKQTVNEGRRMKRSARRNLARYKIRRASLLKKLEEIGFLPSKDQLKNLDKYELFGLRAKGLKERLSPTELGRVFFHLNQRRGYKSNRKTDLKENQKETDYVQNINDLSALLHDRGITIGEYCFEKLQADPHFRIKDTIFLRKDYVDEFNRVWEFQKKFYPEILTEANLRQIRDRLIYFQRRLKSSKHLVSKCQFETDIRVCPRSSPFHQLRRIYQDVNNLRIVRRFDRTEPFAAEGGLLQNDMRTKLLNELESKGSLSAVAIRKLLNLSRNEYDINFPKKENGDDSTSLVGNKTKFQIRQALEETGWTDMSLLEFDYAKEPDSQPLYKLWHLLYSSEDPEKLKSKLEERYGFSDEQANALVTKVHLEQDYSALSVKATKKILPFLQEGKRYSDACALAGYRHSDYLTLEENEVRKLIDTLPLLKWNSLRNPAVEKILNHLINIVNGIIADPELGRPDEIRVELARELQKNASDRRYMTDANAEREKNHDRIRDRIREDVPWITHPRRADIEKYKLWEEFGNVSPYEPNHKIAITDLFDKSLYEVEHIIPKARLFDDSFANKTIASTKLNRAKGDMCGFDYMKSRSDQDFAAFKACVDSHWANHKVGKKKFDYLLMPQNEIQDFINRQLNETAYITKKAVEILAPVCRKVRVTSGTVTDYLRHIWGMNDILQQLNWEHYESLGRIKEIKDEESGKMKKVIDGWSKRDDHRHHAVDAIVIAATKQSMVQRLNTLNQEYKYYKDMKESGPRIPPPSPDFRQKAQEAIASVLVSFKSGKRVATKSKNHIKQHGGKKTTQVTWTPRGFLHKETIYGKIKSQKRVKLDAKFDRAALITHPQIKEIVLARLAEFKNDPKKAFAKLDTNPIWFDKEQTRPITAVTIFDEDYVYKVPLNVSFKEKNVDDIIDHAVRDAVSERLKANGSKSREAFKDLENNPLWLNKEHGIQIKSVRIRARAKELTPLHTDSETGELKDFVFTRNNHHVAIYMDEEGKRYEEVVTFWEALNRKILGQEIIRRVDEQGRKLLVSLQQNELFAFGPDLKDLDLADPKNYPEISKKIYRVQKLSSMYYVFRHHLATTIPDDTRMVSIRSLPNFSGFKIFLNRQNRIQAYEEF